MTRNEDAYPDAESFNPGRWLDSAYPTYKEPLTVYPNLAGYSQFGFGRRTCQGVPIVDQDLFLAMGGLAWAFDLRKKRRPGGIDGTDVEVPVPWNECTPLLIAKPVPFQFDVVIRDGRKKEMLDRMWVDDVEGAEAGMPQIDTKEWSKRRGKRNDEDEDNRRGSNSDEGDIGSDRGSGTSIAGTYIGGVSSSAHSITSVHDLRNDSKNLVCA